MRYLLRCTVVFVDIFCSLIALPADYKPLSLYLTWQSDPTTTMVIRWISTIEETEDTIRYAQGNSGQWCEVTGSHCLMPENHPYLIHSAELKGLAPNSSYIFHIGQTNEPYLFRTLPKTLEELTFIIGGDTHQSRIQYFAETNRQAALHEPAFVVFGGDLSYATPEEKHVPEDIDRWLLWLKTWSDTMKTPNGYRIPLLVTIGNHEVKGRYLQTPQEAPFFYTLFPIANDRCYRALYFGEYMALTFLDSGHTHPMNGEQAAWLAEELASQGTFLHRFVTYHIPAYPSVRNFRQQYCSAVRRYWVPLFEQFGVHVAFENHDHAYKRTYPIIDGAVSPCGVVYIGDGSWGVQPRMPKSAHNSTYLAKTASTRQFVKVLLTQEKREFWAIDPQGTIIDHYIQLTSP